MGEENVDIETAVLVGLCCDRYMLTIDDGFRPELLHLPQAQLAVNALLQRAKVLGETT